MQQKNKNVMEELFYDTKSKTLSTYSYSSTCKLIYTGHQECSERSKNKNLRGPIVLDDGKIVIKIDTYFSNIKNYIRVKIYYNDVLLLPVSQCIKDEKLRIEVNHFPSKLYHWHEGPYTIAQKETAISWNNLFEEICTICNNPREWIARECKTLCYGIQDYYNNNNNAHRNPIHKFIALGLLIKRIFPYEPIVHEEMEEYREFINTNVIDEIRRGFVLLNEEKSSQYKYIKGNIDIMWKYVKDYMYLCK